MPGSLAAAKLGQNLLEWNCLSSFTLRNRFEKHPLRFGIRLERLVAFRKEDRHRSTFRKLRIVQLDSTTDYMT